MASVARGHPTQAARTAAVECYEGADGAFQIEMKRSLERIDDFIMANSTRSVTRDNLESRRAAGLRQLRSNGNICAGNAARVDEALRNSGATALQAGTTDLLSIPREPVMNPCL